MVDANTAIFAGLFVLLGGIALVVARKTYARYTTLTGITDPSDSDDGGAEAVVEGPVTVSDSAVPDRAPPDELDTEDPAALWAWRIRRKVNKSAGDRNQTTWRTVESGLAVGDFSIKDDWESVHVDTSSLTNSQNETVDGEEDPFEADNLYLGEPEAEIRLGDPDPITKRLERWGILGPNGLLGDAEFTLSFGWKTLSPDRYQATLIRDGDEILINGEVDETQDGSMLRGAEERPLIVVTADHDKTEAKLHSTARKQAAVGVVLVLAGAGFLVNGVFGIV